jgi:coenzyme F420-0:L-glutamate ligase/coenzyme F420-1:gamma-L-glutamate ligase
MSGRIEIVAVPGIPEITEGEKVGATLVTAAREAGLGLTEGDVVVVSQKIVSKAEGRVVALADVNPGERAEELAAELERDARFVQLVLDESARVVRAERGVLIVETSSGWVCANAGIDTSNVPGDDMVALLPLDADASACRIRGEIHAATGGAPAVVISDSFGRPWRIGQTDVAIGCAGLEPVADWRGRTDREGRVLEATIPAIADELAAAADLARDKASGSPVALIRGCDRQVIAEDGPGAASLRRAEADDLFR